MSLSWSEDPARYICPGKTPNRGDCGSLRITGRTGQIGLITRRSQPIQMQTVGYNPATVAPDARRVRPPVLSEVRAPWEPRFVRAGYPDLSRMPASPDAFKGVRVRLDPALDQPYPSRRVRRRPAKKT